MAKACGSTVKASKARGAGSGIEVAQRARGSIWLTTCSNKPISKSVLGSWATPKLQNTEVLDAVPFASRLMQLTEGSTFGYEKPTAGRRERNGIDLTTVQQLHSNGGIGAEEKESGATVRHEQLVLLMVWEFYLRSKIEYHTDWILVNFLGFDSRHLLR